MSSDGDSAIERVLGLKERPKEQPARPARRLRRRLWLAGGVFLAGMSAAALKLADIAASASGSADTPAPVVVAGADAASEHRRALTDRNGQTLTGEVRVYELYFDATTLSTPEEGREVVEDLAGLFPEIDRADLVKRFAKGGTHPIKRRVTPREAQEAHDLGWPGLYLRERPETVYYADRLTAHVVGTVGIDGQGQSGVEGALDEMLREEGPPVALSLDLRAQIALRETLLKAIRDTGAKAATGIVMSPKTGEVLALVSAPDFDPHNPPAPPKPGEKSFRSPLFNHAVQGVYELGSVMKLATWALALDTGVARMEARFPPPKPFEVGGFTIRDDHPIYEELTFPMALAKSSNIVSAHLALEAGPEAQRALFKALGLAEPSGIELLEAKRAAPQWPKPWGPSTTAASSYGHGLAITPLHMASVVATLVNGGTRVTPTLLKRDEAPEQQSRVITAKTSDRMREMMRLIVTSGTGRKADAPGLEVGGKTGTAIKTNGRGGYDANRVVSTFASAFPMSAPKAVVVVTLDEPEIIVQGKARRSAGWTAAPVAREVIERVAPLLGVLPDPEAAVR